MNLNVNVGRRFVTFSLIALIGLMAAAVLLAYFNRATMEESMRIRRQVEIVKGLFNYHVDQTLRHMDVGLRGYAVMNDERFLYMKPDQMRRDYDRANERLDSMLNLQGYNDQNGRQALAELRGFMEQYFNYFNSMLTALQSGNMESFRANFERDLGSQHGNYFQNARNFLFAFEDELDQRAENNFKAALNANVYYQLMILLLGAPVIISVLINLRKAAQKRQALLAEQEENNRKYMFDSGQQIETHDQATVAQQTIQNFSTAASFVSQITEGNYNATWPGMSIENMPLNVNTLAGKLTLLKDKLIQLRKEEETRAWTSEGLSQFSLIVRNQQNDLRELSNQVVAFLVRYLKAQQGGLFALAEDETTNQLELLGCYAFERKKYIEKRVAVGHGLVGQTFLEKQTMLLTQIPPGYLQITSGLGEAPPSFLAIVPFKYYNEVQAVFEIASFHRFEPHQVEFLERAGEFFTASLINSRSMAKMKDLVESSQHQAELMKEQEEIIRQNMEELAATQENLQRREKELEAELARYRNGAVKT